MSWPFLYYAGDRLSGAELAGARLDGDVVEVGDAFMPADAVETPALRAASLRGTVPPTLAITRVSAAWVHGALTAQPARHTVQRCSRSRIHHVIDGRLVYRDQFLDARGLQLLGGMPVTTPGRTLADLVRDRCAGEDTTWAVDAMIAWRPGVVDEAIAALAAVRALHHKRTALADLSGRVAGGAGVRMR